MVQARQRPIVTLLLAAVGLAALAALVWWAMASGGQPVVVPVLAATAAPAPTDEAGLRALLRDPAVLARGQRVFSGLCYTCHGLHGEGGSGPNLGDDHWLRGSQMVDLLRAISDGQPGTAMMPMRHTYPPSDLAALAAYVVTLKSQRPANGKAAEGAFAPITYWPVR